MILIQCHINANSIYDYKMEKLCHSINQKCNKIIHDVRQEVHIVVIYGLEGQLRIRF